MSILRITEMHRRTGVNRLEKHSITNVHKIMGGCSAYHVKEGTYGKM